MNMLSDRVRSLSRGSTAPFFVPCVALMMLNIASAVPTTEPTTEPSTAPSTTSPAAQAEAAWYNAHGQATVISEKHDAFHAPYTGPHSLQRDEPIRTSVTASLFLGVHFPWAGGEGYFDPEVAGGQGFSGVNGIAGFPNGEIPRVGTPEPEPYIARLYYRQTFGFGGETEHVDDGPNQLAGVRDVSRLTITVGKFSAVDFFQQSAYSNDPRAQFMNWALFTDAAWDYPADVRGYTQGLVLEFNQPAWTIRYGAMREPKVANGGALDDHWDEALGHALEYEQRWEIDKHPGSVKVLGYLNRSHAGKYSAAIDNPGPHGPDITLSRAYREKYGFSITADQEITSDLGVFGRLGWNDGHSESFTYTEIDRSLSLGLSLKGTRWHRPDDVVGLAGIINALSHEHRQYLGAGGLGFIIGDGQLPHYAPEQCVEAYYLCKVAEHIFVTPDLQYIFHPAYNADRGPVFVGGVRVHVEF